jgi:4-hydroxy-3-methylbut-2-enyl diphosphate reductase
VRKLAGEVDLLIVVGARNSSNSNRLREVGEHMGVNSFLVEDASDLDLSWFNPDLRVGISAGASTPEVLVQEVLKRLDQLGIGTIVEMDAEPETVTFRLPVGLTKKVARKSRGSSDAVINGMVK